MAAAAQQAALWYHQSQSHLLLLRPAGIRGKVAAVELAVGLCIIKLHKRGVEHVNYARSGTGGGVVEGRLARHCGAINIRL